MPKKDMMQIIEIPLRVISKKNSRRNFGHVSLPSKAFENFHSLVAEYLLPYPLHITSAFRITICYYLKGKYRSDIDACVTSVLDILQDYGVVENDDLCTGVKADKKGAAYGDPVNKDWSCYIEIRY